MGAGGGGRQTDRQTDRQKRRETEYRHIDLSVITSACEKRKAMERGLDVGRVRLHANSFKGMHGGREWGGRGQGEVGRSTPLAPQ